MIENSVFVSNGANNGQSHGLYLDSLGEIVLKNIKVISTKEGGHTLKISAPKMLIENSVLLALNEYNSRTIDNFGGGELVVRNSVLQQGPNSDNLDMIGVALEKNRTLKSSHKVFLENNWIIFDNQKNILIKELNVGKLFDANKLGPYILKKNRIVGMATVNQNNVVMQDNMLFENRAEAGLPEYDGSLKSFPIDF